MSDEIQPIGRMTVIVWEVEVNSPADLAPVTAAVISAGAKNVSVIGELTLRVNAPVRINFAGIAGILNVTEINR